MIIFSLVKNRKRRIIFPKMPSRGRGVVDFVKRHKKKFLGAAALAAAAAGAAGAYKYRNRPQAHNKPIDATENKLWKKDRSSWMDFPESTFMGDIVNKPSFNPSFHNAWAPLTASGRGGSRGGCQKCGRKSCRGGCRCTRKGGSRGGGVYDSLSWLGSMVVDPDNGSIQEMPAAERTSLITRGEQSTRANIAVGNVVNEGLSRPITFHRALTPQQKYALLREERMKQTSNYLV